LLKIYIYGYLNRIQSSRRLEREAQRNIELMWLTGRLMPDFKTIANFRKDNSKATHYHWDAAGRLTQTTQPGGATRTYTYNAYGKVTAERDELGRITRYEYADNLQLVSRRINPDGSELRYRYDNSRLLLTEIENERGEHYQLDYYSSGLIQQETGFDGRRTAYEYDLNGNLLKKTEYGDDGSELVTEYQRDSAGRLLVKTLADGEEIHYSYDALGRLVNVDDGHWPLAYEYDSQDRLISEHQGWGTLRYEYDSVGQLKHCRSASAYRAAVSRPISTTPSVDASRKQSMATPPNSSGKANGWS
jgi:YD repeat-containing protein